MPPTYLVRALPFIVLGTMLPRMLPGQAASDSIEMARIRRIAERESRLRIRAGGLDIRLDRPAASATALTGRGASGVDTSVALGDVTRIEGRRGHALTGAIIGGVLGAAAGASAAAIIASWCTDIPPPPYECPKAETGEVIAGGFAGAAVLGGLGAVAGSVFRHWKTLYRRSEPRLGLVVEPTGAGLALGARWRW